MNRLILVRSLPTLLECPETTKRSPSCCVLKSRPEATAPVRWRSDGLCEPLCLQQKSPQRPSPTSALNSSGQVIFRSRQVAYSLRHLCAPLSSATENGGWRRVCL